MTTALMIRKWNGSLTDFDLTYDTGETETVRENAESDGKVIPGAEVEAPVMAGGYAVLRDDLWGYAVLLVHGPGPALVTLRDDPDTFRAWEVSTVYGELDEVIPAGLRTTINNFLSNNGQQNIPSGWTVRRFMRELVGDRLDTTRLGRMD